MLQDLTWHESKGDGPIVFARCRSPFLNAAEIFAVSQSEGRVPVSSGL